MTMFVLVCGNVFDGLSDALTGPAEILVESNRITKIERSVGRPPGAQVIDLSERTVSPGFIDTHVHLTMDAANLALQTLQSSAAKALAGLSLAGYRAFEAELHRVRGETLLQRYSANPAPAEDAFLIAIAIAKQQGTRSFELRAALSLAKLYRATARPADAHAILAPALEDFAPTPEFPEIAEAMELVAAIKAAGAQL
jgi:imidazolonepropionase-like amidohydrolase